MIDWNNDQLSVVRQCKIINVPRSSMYYRESSESNENIDYMDMIDKEYTKHPFLGYRKMTDFLCRKGHLVNEKRIRRLMGILGLEAIYPKKKTSIPDQAHYKYPYLLKGYSIERPNQVWSTDITYIKLDKGFVYLTAVIDWYSRYVLSWRLSNTLDSRFCIEALNEALTKGKPEIFNTDQGSQFTSIEFTGILQKEGIRISMDGKGRALDNIFVERLWRSVKYEESYLNAYATVDDAYYGLRNYFEYYNNERPHQSLGYRTPEEVHNNLVDRDLKSA